MNYDVKVAYLTFLHYEIAFVMKNKKIYVHEKTQGTYHDIDYITFESDESLVQNHICTKYLREVK